ncbi:MAG: hypothetical protein KBS81_10785 [Spirochaetales bacterium]|nr:hypothetical protein [Candidatus Physcosoma equi]
MKKAFLTLLLLTLSLSLFAGLAPPSKKIGEVAVSWAEDSVEAFIQKALSKPYTEEWLSTYTLEKEAFALAYTTILCDLLPMKNFLLSTYRDGEISVLSLETGKVVTFLMKEGRISALHEN